MVRGQTGVLRPILSPSSARQEESVLYCANRSPGDTSDSSLTEDTAHADWSEPVHTPKLTAILKTKVEDASLVQEKNMEALNQAKQAGAMRLGPMLT